MTTNKLSRPVTPRMAKLFHLYPPYTTKQHPSLHTTGVGYLHGLHLIFQWAGTSGTSSILSTHHSSPLKKMKSKIRCNLAGSRKEQTIPSYQPTQSKQTKSLMFIQVVGGRKGARERIRRYKWGKVRGRDCEVGRKWKWQEREEVSRHGITFLCIELLLHG